MVPVPSGGGVSLFAGVVLNAHPVTRSREALDMQGLPGAVSLKLACL